jgi:hypothetical protein
MEDIQERTNAVQTKIDLVDLTIRDVQVASEDTDDGDTLLSVLEEYKSFLVRQRDRLATDYEDIVRMKQAIRDAGCVLADVFEVAADSMIGWYECVMPHNTPQAFANILSHIITTLSGSVHTFESYYPELKNYFNWERRRQAALIRAEELDARRAEERAKQVAVQTAIHNR